MSKFLFMALSSLLLLSTSSFAASSESGQTSYDVACRSQAKDTAVKIYQSCIAENKQKRLGEIRKEYQAKLNDLKKYYDSELKKLSSGANASAAGGTASNLNTSSASGNGRASVNQNTNGVAKTLPQKTISSKTQPVQSQNLGTAVITKSSDDQNGDVEVVQPGSDDLDGSME